MDSELSVFVDSVAPLAEVRTALVQIVGPDFDVRERDVGTLYCASILDIRWELVAADGYEDDAGIPFTRYLHQLMLVPLHPGCLAAGFAAMYEAIARYVGERLAVVLGCRTILVANLQRQLAAFDGRPDP